MLTHMKTQTIDGLTNIIFTVPTEEADKVQKAITGFLNLAGLQVRKINSEGEELFSSEEVFPESHPGSRLRGLRLRDELTQKSLAEKLAILPHHISEMEKGSRPIGKEMAKKLSMVFQVTYKMFL